jgi:hypothetical protein
MDVTQEILDEEDQLTITFRVRPFPTFFLVWKRSEPYCIDGASSQFNPVACKMIVLGIRYSYKYTCTDYSVLRTYRGLAVAFMQAERLRRQFPM